MLIHPFDHADIVAGQGTCGLEILEQCPGRRRPCSCPPAAAACSPGIATAVKALRPDVRVVGVQAEGAAAYPELARAGAPGRRWRR